LYQSNFKHFTSNACALALGFAIDTVEGAKQQPVCQKAEAQKLTKDFSIIWSFCAFMVFLF
jgi:hypothetical protein